MVDFPVMELGPADHPEPGDRAPDFTRPLVNEEYWTDRTLSDLAADGSVVLVFTPMVGSFPAQYVWDEIRDRGWADETTVVGLSISTPYHLAAYIRERGYPFEQFSDPNNGVTREYGIVNDLDGMGGVSEPRPAAFVLDEELTVEYAWVATEWPEFPPYDEIEDALGR